MFILEGLVVDLGDKQLGPIDLQIPAGTHVMFRGPSGCGKTSLLEAIAGLRTLKSGRILLNGLDLAVQPPAKRFVGFAPQDGALFGSITVAKNLEFPLRFRNVTRVDRQLLIDEIAEKLQISQLLNRLPVELSGGEKQRVALGRAMLSKPQLLLLDEPFSALDDLTKNVIRRAVGDFHEQTGCTILHASHDFSDIDALAERVVLMRHCRIEHSDAPLIDRTAFEFLGA